MSKDIKFVHPYIPNSVPEIQKKMLEDIGAASIEELYEDIPEEIRFRGKMNLPEPFVAECDLRRHVGKILSKNQTCGEYISFLGGGCYQHYVPAICDEINHRSEFLTAYAGEPYEDHGRFQSLFEYASMMGELLDMDIVNVPTYDWSQATSTSIRMAGRITDRTEVLICETIAPDRLTIIRNYCRNIMQITLVKRDKTTGCMDLNDLKSKISSKTAGVYFENPSYHGIIDSYGQEISDIAHENGALSLVGTDPISLGILKPPAQYGADIVSGDIQGLGIHMQLGGSLAGFIATRDEERYVMEYPSRLFGISGTSVEGEWGFGDVAYDRTSFGTREQGKEFIGTATALWGITAGVYLSLAGPDGMKKLGKTIVQKSQYAMKKLSSVKGLNIPFAKSSHFKEFAVDFSDSGKSGKSVREVNQDLLKKGIFGGKDISGEFPDLGSCALICVTEIHTKDDIDSLVDSLNDIINS